MSGVFEALSEEECYLIALLQDESGIDLAEFCWQAPENDDNCFRAYPYQWAWWRCDDPLQIDQCGRSVGKTLGIKARMFAHPFANPGQEAVITAPELVHLEPICQLVETQFEACRLGREMMSKKPTHRPFMAAYVNGARIIGRIPQRDGKGVKGTHPLKLEHDEASDYPEDGWKELIETLKRGQQGAVWRAHGVTRGMRDSFYKFSQHGQDDPPLRYVSHKSDNRWTVHRIVAQARPTWTDAERQEKIQQYGSRDDPDYRRNVIGSHGDSQSPIFVLHRLMRCVDDDPSSDFNSEEYWEFRIKDTELERMNCGILDILDPPSSHTAMYKTFWMGMDVGYTIDPSEIIIAAEYPLRADERNSAKKRGKAVPIDDISRLKIIGRVTLNRIGEPDQAEVMIALIDHYKPVVFAMDSGGNGLPLFQNVQRRMQDVADATKSARARRAAECIRGYKFNNKLLVDFDETVEIDDDATLDDRIKEAGIKRDVLEHSTDILRTYVDEGRLWFPWDTELIDEMRGQTYSYSKNKMDGYGRKRIFSNGSFHALDALRMLAMGHRLNTIETLLRQKEPETEPVLDVFLHF